MTDITFRDLGVRAELASSLAADGKTTPFPIQQDTLPDTLAGRDVLGRGRTGSGKTIAFALPLVQRLAAAPTRTESGRPRGLVLAPTRELATQIAATIEPLARAVGLTVTTIFGGVKQTRQVDALRRAVDIVVACPGRLEDLMQQREARLDRVEIAVLDEADHMADLGFLPGVTRILAATPAGGQRLLFSATLDNGVDRLTRRFLDDPVTHSVDESSVPAGEMSHRVLVVADRDEKSALVRELASGLGRRILFTRTKHQAKKLAKQLTTEGIPAVDLQGNLSQNARDRNLAAFSADPADGGVRVLVATDVAARGIHVDSVELVVHVDPPVEHKAYLHRSGRTARAGASGTVVTVVVEDEVRETKSLLRRARIDAPFEQVTAASPAIAELVGPPAPHVEPQPDAPQQQGGRGQSGRGGRGQSVRGGGQPGRAPRTGGQPPAPPRSAPRPAASAATTTAEQPRQAGDAGSPSRRRRRGGRGREPRRRAANRRRVAGSAPSAALGFRASSGAVGSPAAPLSRGAAAAPASPGCGCGSSRPSRGSSGGWRRRSPRARRR